MPARYELVREYEMSLAEDMLAMSYPEDRPFAQFCADVLPDGVTQQDDLAQLLWDASESGRLCASAEHRSALQSLVSVCAQIIDSRLSCAHAPEAVRWLRALVQLAGLHHLWIRPAGAWTGGEAEGEELGSLARHLLAKYDVPRCMDSLFSDDTHTVRAEWFAHVGQGGSLRTAPGMPVPVTRRMAHLFSQSADDLDFVSALRQAQVAALGGTPELARALCRTWLGRRLGSCSEERWWAAAIRWMAAQPDLKPVEVGPVADYLRDCSRRDADYGFKGRTMPPLREAMERWHRQLRKARERKRARQEAVLGAFDASNLRPGQWRMRDGSCWTFSEIRTLKALDEEGAGQAHCVGTYEHAIRSGWCVIWSLRVQRRGGTSERALTVEVCLSRHAIVQARGAYNRWPTPEEERILAFWAEANGLKIDLED